MWKESYDFTRQIEVPFQCPESKNTYRPFIHFKKDKSAISYIILLFAKAFFIEFKRPFASNPGHPLFYIISNENAFI